MSWTKFALAVPSLAVLILAFGWLVPPGTMLGEAPRTATPSASSKSSPEPSPGLSYPLTGRVARLIPGGMVVDSAGREVEVSFSNIVDVWKETSVAASAIEVGDVLFVGGGHVWANGGRIDGVIQEIDATGMLIDVRGPYGPRGLQRVDFSPYIEYGRVDDSVRLTRADFVVGREIGTVIYGRAGAPLRATRIWFW